MNLKLMTFVLAVAALAIAISLPGAFAETEAKSTVFEKTTIIEFTNTDSVNINTVRIWLGRDAGDFKSFKTEDGWVGTRAAEGLLVFTSADPLGPGDSVKFGIKTEVASPGINWRTIDTSGNELSVGRTSIDQEAAIIDPVQQDPTPSSTDTQVSFDSAKFRIIPESPKNGDEIRIVGDGFPANIPLNFLINNEQLADFSSDASGNVIGRAQVPQNTQAERVEFSLSDNNGNKKTISIRITQTDQVLSSNGQRLTITQSTDVVGPSETARVSGTAKPGGTVAITARNADGQKIYEAIAPVDAQGNWSHETIIPPDADLGTRQVEFRSGQEVITKTLSISITKSIKMNASATRYEPGETMRFNGTASLGAPVEMILKDPAGREIFYNIINVNSTGTINFDYETQQSSPKGTYVLIATQGPDSEILRIGLGESPSQQIVAKFDKLNYATSEIAQLTIQGPARASVSILIIDPSDKALITDSTILGADGRKDYEINLSGYKTGVYSVVLKYPPSQINEVFAVGLLQTGSGPITMQSTKQKYQLGDNILLLGSTKSNVLLKLEMHDPSGKLEKSKQIFTDKEGKFSEGTFRVPVDAVQGMWTVRASNGPNYAETKIEVVGTVGQAFVVNVDKSTPYKSGDTMTITGTGAGKTQTAVISIYNINDVRIQELTVSTTDSGGFQPLWILPPEIAPGDYTIKAKVGNVVAETTFKVQ